MHASTQLPKVTEIPRWYFMFGQPIYTDCNMDRERCAEIYQVPSPCPSWRMTGARMEGVQADWGVAAELCSACAIELWELGTMSACHMHSRHVVP